MKKLLALFLLLASVLCFAACPGGQNPGTTPGGDDETEVDYLDNVGSHDFGGKTVTFSAMSSYAYEIYYEEEKPDDCDVQILQRNRRLESRFNIEIVSDYQAGDDANTHRARVNMALSNGDVTFDVAMVQIWMTGPLITDGYFLDLRHEVPYVKDSMGNVEWWSDDINIAYTIYGRQFVGISDINLSAIKVTWAYLFNKGMEQEYNIASGLGYESLYDMVRKGAWTLDNVRGIVKDFYRDSDTDGIIGQKDEADTYGLLSSGSWWTDVASAACGIRFITNDGETTPEITPFTSFAGIVNGLSDLALSNGFFTPTTTSAIDKFAQGTALMVMTTLGSLEGDTIHDSDVDFGVLPFPKADANQTAYHSGSQDAMTSLEVPTTVEGRVEMVGAVLEALSAESHRVVLPSYYELILKSKNTRDQESLEMIDIIYEGRLYDFASIHSYNQDELYVAATNGGLMYVMRHFINNPTSVANVWESASRALGIRLGEIVKKYENMY